MPWDRMQRRRLLARQLWWVQLRWQRLLCPSQRRIHGFALIHGEVMDTLPEAMTGRLRGGQKRVLPQRMRP